MSRTSKEILEAFEHEVPKEHQDPRDKSAYMCGSMSVHIAWLEREIERISQIADTLKAIIKPEAD